MPTISATFKNDYSESRRWVIQDIGIDQDNPKTIFDDYLEPNAVTDPLSLYNDGFNSVALYKRSDGSPTRVDVRDGDQVSMS